MSLNSLLVIWGFIDMSFSLKVAGSSLTASRWSNKKDERIKNDAASEEDREA